MSQVIVTIGPADHGRRMSLDEYEQAEFQEGRRYELGRGVVVVSDVPHPLHGGIVAALHDYLSVYKIVTRPGVIHRIFTGSECRVLLTELQSERHPDLAVYKFGPPSDEDVWSTWVPELVVEVVSPGSEQRDYVEKREEYLAFGCKEYWIIDPQRSEMLALRRHGGRWREKVVAADGTYETPLLPGLALDLAKVFAAA